MSGPIAEHRGRSRCRDWGRNDDPNFFFSGYSQRQRLSGAVPSRLHCGDSRLDHYTVISSGLRRGTDKIVLCTKHAIAGRRLKLWPVATSPDKREAQASCSSVTALRYRASSSSRLFAACTRRRHDPLQGAYTICKGLLFVSLTQSAHSPLHAASSAASR
jgi:hypothetical protein